VSDDEIVPWFPAENDVQEQLHCIQALMSEESKIHIYVDNDDDADMTERTVDNSDENERVPWTSVSSRKTNFEEEDHHDDQQSTNSKNDTSEKSEEVSVQSNEEFSVKDIEDITYHSMNESVEDESLPWISILPQQKLSDEEGCDEQRFTKLDYDPKGIE